MAGSTEIGEASDNPVEINVVAMVDVIFCLCIFFMCSFHFKQIEGKIETWMPLDRDVDFQRIDPPILEEIRVFFASDLTKGTTTRRFGACAPVRDDAELLAGLKRRADDYRRAGRSRIPVLLDASDDVPWTDIVHVIDLCRQMGLSEIEFAAPR